jgi:hypothetical protein
MQHWVVCLYDTEDTKESSRCKKLPIQFRGSAIKTTMYLKMPSSYIIGDVQGVLESSRTVIVVTASVKEDERGGQGHTSASLLHQSVT